MGRRTLATSTRVLRGVGLHSGTPAWVQVLPFSEGIIFRSAKTRAVLPALLSHVLDTTRCTVLGSADGRLQTVEHVLSALAGLQITDAEIVFEGEEVPALDGSALMFVEALQEAGFSELASPHEPITLSRPVVVAGREGELLAAAPAQNFSATVVIEYPERAKIGTQAASFRERYAEEIAPARTYGFLSELEWLRARKLALGASEENVVALTDEGAADPRTPLRLANELARHKLLDLIGDLSLLGRPLSASVLGVRTSHTLNIALANAIMNEAALLSSERGPGDEG